jgi:hypothetical protein
VIRSLTLPFDNDDFPYAELGWLVAINYGGDVTRGIVSANTLQVQRQGSLGALSVRQQLSIGESQTNLYSKLRNMVANDPLQLATVTSPTDGAGLASVQFPNGGTARLRVLAGVTVTAGQSVWVRRGTIERRFPALTRGPVRDHNLVLGDAPIELTGEVFGREDDMLH